MNRGCFFLTSALFCLRRSFFSSVKQFCFFFSQTDQPPVFRPAILLSAVLLVVVWWHGHCTLPPASPPRGECCFYNPSFLFVNIFQCPTAGINSSLMFEAVYPSLAPVSLLFLCPDSGYQFPSSSSSACLCWRGCGADTHNKTRQAVLGWKCSHVPAGGCERRVPAGERSDPAGSSSAQPGLAEAERQEREAGRADGEREDGERETRQGQS